jgi:hypothetical protein
MVKEPVVELRKVKTASPLALVVAFAGVMLAPGVEEISTNWLLSGLFELSRAVTVIWRGVLTSKLPDGALTVEVPASTAVMTLKDVVPETKPLVAVSVEEPTFFELIVKVAWPLESVVGETGVITSSLGRLLVNVIFTPETGLLKPSSAVTVTVPVAPVLSVPGPTTLIVTTEDAGSELAAGCSSCAWAAPKPR